MTNRSIMIQGTGSHVGKSILVCALCRILKQDGYRVAPFKAQNMALNSFVTKDGKEMGRAQVAQAEAAGIEPMVEMNPILLKPTGDCGSQVVIMGKPIGNMTAREYYQKKGEFISIIKGAYDTLRNRFDIIVIEGAGSPAEINLKDDDIVNMGMAKMASAPVLLVTDIDRGGAFAWIVGTLELLTATERDRVKGIVFNKFRGDKGILQPGLDMLENRINKPVLGIIPYIHNLSIDDEDSVSLEYSGNNDRDQGSGVRGQNTGDKALTPDSRLPASFIDIVVIKLPRISNFTDFNIFTHGKDVRVRFVDKAENIGKPDLLIIPGTKNTIGDLIFLEERDISEEIKNLSMCGTMIMGICGGYQMLGKQINDPYHVESATDSIQGMGLLNTVTTFAREKQTYQVKASLLDHENLFHVNDELAGYEIHMGDTIFNGHKALKPFARITERAGKTVNILDGCVSADGKVLGTYIHGIFDNDEFRLKLMNCLRSKKGLEPSRECHVGFKSIKEQRYNKLADIVRENMDMNTVYNILKLS
ncbi:MAG: cobyric acid synthase [Candidatus Brocadia sp. AMX2]|nr:MULTISPECIES: cobyric acid synthase [Brocadia]MBC6931482.1 cobyric acid synthase [Candidatus Brocadia sp.]MBL1169131.1 cobyric acid synthase [Candidatus Brocadia sp. AMX1]MCK6468939.1 cobyric acid synthase [Candidatus Brocadia sinica]NOG42016.1 cobyric acid synthase [Planctomycetota bacterium]KAA0244918.1 MAG: cobyric acid synthase [Candidatus Brocadia sp. AMX2]